MQKSALQGPFDTLIASYMDTQTTTHAPVDVVIVRRKVVLGHMRQRPRDAAKVGKRLAVLRHLAPLVVFHGGERAAAALRAAVGLGRKAAAVVGAGW